MRTKTCRNYRNFESYQSDASSATTFPESIETQDAFQEREFATVTEFFPPVCRPAPLFLAVAAQERGVFRMDNERVMRWRWRSFFRSSTSSRSNSPQPTGPHLGTPSRQRPSRGVGRSPSSFYSHGLRSTESVHNGRLYRYSHLSLINSASKIFTMVV